VTSQYLRWQVLALQFGLGCIELGPHIGDAGIDGVELFAQLLQAFRAAAVGVQRGAAVAAGVLLEAFDELLGPRELVADLVGRALVLLCLAGLGLLDGLVQLAQALQLRLGLRVERGGSLVLGQHAQGLQGQGQVGRDQQPPDRLEHRAPGLAGVDGSFAGGNG